MAFRLPPQPLFVSQFLLRVLQHLLSLGHSTLDGRQGVGQLGLFLLQRRQATLSAGKGWPHTAEGVLCCCEAPCQVLNVSLKAVALAPDVTA